MLAAQVREEVEIPEGVEVKLTGRAVEVSGSKGKLTKTFDIPGVALEQNGKLIVIGAALRRRKQRAAVGTIKSHL